jgi:hypothetical protein
MYGVVLLFVKIATAAAAALVCFGMLFVMIAFLLWWLACVAG